MASLKTNKNTKRTPLLLPPCLTPGHTAPIHYRGGLKMFPQVLIKFIAISKKVIHSPSFFKMVWSKASHLMSRKWAFCGMMCNLLCKSRKTIHEKSRFKALKTWIIYFFECNNLLRIQDGPFNPKYLHFDFWFDTPLEQCGVVVTMWIPFKVTTRSEGQWEKMVGIDNNLNR